MVRRSMMALVVILLAIPCVGSAHAGTITAIEYFEGGSPATAGSEQLYGWDFKVLNAIWVTNLGVYDFHEDGLADSHDVGIFRTSDQTLLGSLTLSAGTGSTLNNGFRYDPVSSAFLLTPGRYTIAMTMPQETLDAQYIETDFVVTATQIVYETSRFDSGSSLAFPTTTGAFEIGLFGPNFQFTTAVPEPATILGLSIGGLGLVALCRKNRKVIN